MSYFLYFVIFAFSVIPSAWAKLEVCLRNYLNAEVEIHRWLNNNGILVKEQTTKSYKEINASNFEEIFQHQYIYHELPDVKGAKSLFYKTNNNEQIIIFWKTGDSLKPNNIHHRDALASMLKNEYEVNADVFVKTDSGEEMSDVLKNAQKK
ncbi:MAG: hypothetical protein JNM93_12425 [Bacteriovoracaceae bacterium]|nr:hypothetical protein [Bacteriovoracaceae bacterium]